ASLRDVFHQLHRAAEHQHCDAGYPPGIWPLQYAGAVYFLGLWYPYLLFQIIGGMTADRFGPRKTLFVSGLIWAGATLVTGLATGFATLVLARVVMGFGVGATLPTATRAMQHWVEMRKRGFAQGITHAFSRLGNALTPVATVALMVAFTWRGAFVITGL